jgi:hypothetical protein
MQSRLTLARRWCARVRYATLRLLGLTAQKGTLPSRGSGTFVQYPNKVGLSSPTSAKQMGLESEEREVSTLLSANDLG